MGSAKKKRKVSDGSLKDKKKKAEKKKSKMELEADEYLEKEMELQKKKEEKKKKKRKSEGGSSKKKHSSGRKNKPITGKNSTRAEAKKKEQERLEWQKIRVKGLENKGEERTRGEIGIISRIKRKFPCFIDMEFELKGFAKETAELLHLTRSDLRWLRYHFNQIDIDDSGEIDYDELFSYMDETRTPFTDKLFQLIDIDGNGFVDFNEFIQLLSTYGMYKKEDILRFAFDCFDKDASGTLDEEEFQDLAKTVQGANPMFPGSFKKALEQFDKNDDGLIDFNEFRDINNKFPLLLYPAFRLQDRVQKCTLGEKKWNEILKFRQFEKEVQYYRDTHGGAMPTEPIGKKIVRILTFKPDPYARLLKEEETTLTVKKKSKGDVKRKKAKKDRGDDEEEAGSPSVDKM